MKKQLFTAIAIGIALIGNSQEVKFESKEQLRFGAFDYVNNGNIYIPKYSKKEFEIVTYNSSLEKVNLVTKTTEFKGYKLLSEESKPSGYAGIIYNRSGDFQLELIDDSGESAKTLTGNLGKLALIQHLVVGEEVALVNVKPTILKSSLVSINLSTGLVTEVTLPFDFKCPAYVVSSMSSIENSENFFVYLTAMDKKKNVYQYGLIVDPKGVVLDKYDFTERAKELGTMAIKFYTISMLEDDLYALNGDYTFNGMANTGIMYSVFGGGKIHFAKYIDFANIPGYFAHFQESKYHRKKQQEGIKKLEKGKMHYYPYFNFSCGAVKTEKGYVFFNEAFNNNITTSGSAVIYNGFESTHFIAVEIDDQGNVLSTVETPLNEPHLKPAYSSIVEFSGYENGVVKFVMFNASGHEKFEYDTGSESFQRGELERFENQYLALVMIKRIGENQYLELWGNAGGTYNSSFTLRVVAL
jgi:hypothetical protein